MTRFNLKRALIAVLACLLCFSMLVACGEPESTTGTTTDNTDTGTTDTTDTTATTDNQEPPVDPNRVLTLVEDYEVQYRIVVPKNAKSYEMDAAYNIRLALLTVTGANPSIVEDDTEPEENEIVIGANNSRNTLYDEPDDYADGYCVFVSENRLILEAGSKEGMKRAVQKLCKDCFNVNIYYNDIYKGEEKSELTVKASYTKSESFNASSFYIVHNDSLILKRMAYTWIKNFQSISGLTHVVEGDMGAVAPVNSGDVIITFVKDETVGDGAWKLHKKDEGVYEVHAADYYGFYAAGIYYKKYVNESKKKGSELPPYPESTMGTHKDAGIFTRAEESSLYAFDHTADIRVMFNNVLWGSPEYTQRDQFNAEMVSVYMPDVLGLQEVSLDRRGNVMEGNGGVIAQLAELGYVEAIDPRVRNSYGTNEDIPGTDAYATTGENAGQPLKGYGQSNYTVTVNGETFTTFYNNTPLLYNAATTRFITGEYYWYKNQWDKRPGQQHDNGAGDCASKAATWGLFEDIETGARYIAISTHMCTRSDYVRGLQGAEVVALIDQLIATYNVPVMFGGDYNGNINSANYAEFVNGGMVNVQREKLGSIYNSPSVSHHGPYPEYNQEYKLVVPAVGDNSGATNMDNNIDHIMVKNHETMDITVYGVVIDEMSKSSADHFPIFIDFSIKAAQEE